MCQGTDGRVRVIPCQLAETSLCPWGHGPKLLTERLYLCAVRHHSFTPKMLSSASNQLPSEYEALLSSSTNPRISVPPFGDLSGAQA